MRSLETPNKTYGVHIRTYVYGTIQRTMDEILRAETTTKIIYVHNYMYVKCRHTYMYIW